MAGYLYNGVPLPKLPDWDKTVYPYAVIVKKTTSPTHTLYMMKTPVVYVESTGQYRVNGDLLYADHYSDIGWDTVTSYGANLFYTPDVFIWTNTDILNSDGSVYLAASDPIPVGTAPTIEPLSMWLGWKAGNWVARQRGKA